MQTISDRISSVFSYEKLALWISQLIPNLIAAALTFAAFYLVWRALARVVTAVLVRAEIDATARSFVNAVLKYGLLTVGTVSSLSQLGINTGSLLASLGVAGLTIGFAARDALSNLISGIFIFWDRPFVIGDLVEIAGSYGRVDVITMRSTRVVTVDGKMLAIPNATIIHSTVTSYTNFPHLRLDVALTVGLDEDYDRVCALLIEVAQAHEQTMSDRTPVVVMKSVNDYNVEMELQVWISDEKRHVAVRSELRRKMYEVLRRAQVVMPYETIQLAPVQVAQRVIA